MHPLKRFDVLRCSFQHSAVKGYAYHTHLFLCVKKSILYVLNALRSIDSDQFIKTTIYTIDSKVIAHSFYV